MAISAMQGFLNSRSSHWRYLTIVFFLLIGASHALSHGTIRKKLPLCTESRGLEGQTICTSDPYLLPVSQTVLSLGSGFKLLERTSLPVQNSTKSFWLDTAGANPLADDGSAGKLTENADVCIIGSGITGISTAWHLSKMLGESTPEDAQTSVVILEARRFCSGATGRNGGHLTRNPFLSFLDRQAGLNTSEAVKSFLLEQYSTVSLVDFIHEKDLTNEVDFVHAGLATVFRTEHEEIKAREDWAAAKHAGLEAEITWLKNTDLIQQYGLNPQLNYTGLFTPEGHNVWPCKVVTNLFKDAHNVSTNVDISLHTHTPVTAITRNFWPFEVDDASALTKQHRRWKLQTPRGSIGCSYVVHATNGYASHLLPFLAGINKTESALHHGSADLTSSRPPPGEEHPPQLPRPHPEPPSRPPSRGLYGVIPTRGQVGAVRAAVDTAHFKWTNAWDGGAGWEYFFPRYQDTKDESTNTTKNPLIILGGERQFSGGKLEAGVADDSSLNPLVSTALRSFLPHFFPEQFSLPLADAEDERALASPGGWEMEWTGIMAFTKDGDPFVGPVAVPEELSELGAEEAHYEGQYIAAGYSGHGMPRAYACAEAVAGMIKAQITGEQWTKPHWLPEHYLTWASRA